MASPNSTHSADLDKLLKTPLVDLSARRKSDRDDAASSSLASSSAKRHVATPLSAACAAAAAAASGSDSEHKRRLTFSTLTNDPPLELPSMKKKQPTLPPPADAAEQDEFLNSPKNGHFADDAAGTPLAQTAVKSVDTGKKSNQQQLVKQPIGPPRLATAARSRPTPTPAVAAAAPPRSSFTAAALRKPSANQTVSAVSAARRDRTAAAKPPIPTMAATKRPRPTATTTTTSVSKVSAVASSTKREPFTKENRVVRANAPVQMAAVAVEVPPIACATMVDEPAEGPESAVEETVAAAVVVEVESTPKRARRAIDTPMKRLFDQAMAAKQPTTPPMEQKVNRAMTFDP